MQKLLEFQPHFLYPELQMKKALFIAGIDWIRMEPVFMILGQSAAMAACLAIDNRQAVQKVPYALLKKKLLEREQVLQTTN